MVAMCAADARRLTSPWVSEKGLSLATGPRQRDAAGASLACKRTGRGYLEAETHIRAFIHLVSDGEI